LVKRKRLETSVSNPLYSLFGGCILVGMLKRAIDDSHQWLWLVIRKDYRL